MLLRGIFISKVFEHSSKGVCTHSISIRRPLMKKAVSVAVLVLFIALMLGGIASAGTVLEGILKKGELVVGITGDQPPLNATTKDGKIIGLDADIAQAIAMSMNVKIRFSKMPFSELLPA